MSALPDMIPVRIEGLDVPRALSLLQRFSALLEKLWTSGSLRGLLDTPEGKAATTTWEQIATSLHERLHEATIDEAERLDVAIDIPGPYARSTIVFVQGMLRRGVASGDLTEEDLTFAEHYIDQALRGVSMAGF